MRLWGQMETTTVQPTDIKAIHSINEQLAQSFLIDFIEYNNPRYETRWFHEKICSTLDELVRGNIQKLMVFVPPQHGKSLIISENLPAFALGRDPTTNIVLASYSSDLAQKFNRKVQRLIDTPAYRKLFPQTRLNSKSVSNDSKGNWLRNTEVFEIVGKGGSFKAVGVEGPLTGNPIDIGIIDDPVKDSLEAQSRVTRQRTWEWYNDVFLTRCNNLSRKLLVMTRWHEDDLAGRILAYEKGWAVLSFPAIKEDDTNPDDPRQVGEALWENEHSKEEILAIKSSSERTFASLYQQRPAPLEGGIFKRNWWKFWERLPARFDKVIFSWDCAFKDLKTSDYVVGLVLAKAGADTYVVDMLRGKWDFPETVKRIREMHHAYPTASDKLVEEKANGAAVIQVLRHEIPGLIPICPTESKEARAQAVSSIVESGNVYLPAFAPWRDIALYELSVFPNGVNDDIVDALTQALNRLYVSPNQTARLLHMAGVR